MDLGLEAIEVGLCDRNPEIDLAHGALGTRIEREATRGFFWESRFLVDFNLDRGRVIGEIIGQNDAVAISLRGAKICQEQITYAFVLLGIVVAGQIFLKLLEQLLLTSDLLLEFGARVRGLNIKSLPRE